MKIEYALKGEILQVVGGISPFVLNYVGCFKALVEL